MKGIATRAFEGLHLHAADAGGSASVTPVLRALRPRDGTSARVARRVDALVLDAATRQALVMARSLGRAGHSVGLAEAVDETRPGFGAPAFASRWASGSAVLPSFRADAGGYSDALLTRIAEWGAEVIVPATDGSIAAVRAARAALASRATVALASEGALDIANDKDRTLALARQLGIAVPRSVVATSADEVRAALREVGLPAVIKPSRSWVRQNGIGWRAVPQAVVDVAEAVACYAVLGAAGSPAIVQQWVPGAREAISLVYARGRTWAEFAQVAYRMLPVLGGLSVVRESIAVPPDLSRAARALIEALNLEGCSEIEFRRDAEGRPLLMEINARLSGSVEIAVRAGIDFPLLLWSWAAGEPLIAQRSYRTGLRMRYFSGDVRWLMENLRHRGRPDSTPPLAALGTFAAEFVRGDGYDYVDRHDLKPALVASALGVRAASQWLGSRVRPTLEPSVRLRAEV